MILAIDIGATYIKYGIVDDDYLITAQNKVLTPKQSLETLLEALDAVVEEFRECAGIAIAAPGTIDQKQDCILGGGGLEYLDHVRLRPLLSERYGKRVSLLNDGKCAALGELASGSLSGYHDAVVMVLGSGVGGGLILDGKLRDGAHFYAGEISFIFDSFVDGYNDQKMFAKRASAVALIQSIIAAAELPETTTGEEVFDLIRSGHPEAQRLFKRFCFEIANQIVNLQYILDVEVYAMGGGISAQPLVVQEIRTALKTIYTGFHESRALPEVIACTLGNNANLIGAAYHYHSA